MFKKFLIGMLVAVLVIAVGGSVLTALAASEPDPQDVTTALETEIQEVPAAPVMVAENSVESSLPTDLIPGTTTTADPAGLLYMYEEEKLARDVYNALYALWGQATFQNIAVSEQTHMDSIQPLLVQYGITVPSTAPGTFNDATLQNLYNTLVSQGSISLAEALKVGATIEEVDIRDLQTRLAQNPAADIQLVYNNLMNGSYNHLRNFVNVLSRQTGEVYQPQYLSADLYQSILSATNGNGQGNGAASSTTTTGHGQGTGSTTTTTGSRGYRGGR